MFCPGFGSVSPNWDDWAACLASSADEAASAGTLFMLSPRPRAAQEYFDRIGDCHFCFTPKGLGFWSNRLYEACRPSAQPK